MDQTISIVCGAQFGSEGKGAVSAWLADQLDNPVCVRVGGPNAGHTVVAPNGKTYKLQHIPTGIVWGNTCYIAAGSEIDISILNYEVKLLEDDGFPVKDRLIIDESATVLLEKYSMAERGGVSHGEAGLTKRIGSTGKGVGAARAARIWREAVTIRDTVVITDGSDYTVGDTRIMLEDAIQHGESVLIEGTQGWGLGYHTKYYPFCTSGDCRAIDFLSQVGLSPWAYPGVDLQVWLVARTYPIRVAGNSGPLLGEISWEAVGQPVEHTTVTKKPRRVGNWDPNLVREAISANGGYGVNLVLTFLDYLYPKLKYETNWYKIQEMAGDYLEELGEDLGVPVAAVGTGPSCIVKARSV